MTPPAVPESCMSAKSGKRTPCRLPSAASRPAASGMPSPLTLPSTAAAEREGCQAPKSDAAAEGDCPLTLQSGRPGLCGAQRGCSDAGRALDPGAPDSPLRSAHRRSTLRELRRELRWERPPRDCAGPRWPGWLTARHGDNRPLLLPLEALPGPTSAASTPSCCCRGSWEGRDMGLSREAL